MTFFIAVTLNCSLADAVLPGTTDERSMLSAEPEMMWRFTTDTRRPVRLQKKTVSRARRQYFVLTLRSADSLKQSMVSCEISAAAVSRMAVITFALLSLCATHWESKHESVTYCIQAGLNSWKQTTSTLLAKRAQSSWTGEAGDLTRGTHPPPQGLRRNPICNGAQDAGF